MFYLLPLLLRTGQLIFSLIARRQQKTFYRCSLMSEINRSILQGSRIGPYPYILMESDLHTLSKSNVMFKFADDTNL
jgi:hypothetical protein